MSCEAMLSGWSDQEAIFGEQFFMSSGPRTSARDESRISTTARAVLRGVACDFCDLIEPVS